VHEEGFKVAFFALVNKKGALLDKFSCVFTDSTLETLKENLVTYSEQLPTSDKKIPNLDSDAIGSSSINVDGWPSFPVVDFVHLTNWQDAHAEICFWNYSQASMADRIRTEKLVQMPTWGVALLRCKIELQRAFLEQLYPA
jgi:hypothetical protein